MGPTIKLLSWWMIDTVNESLLSPTNTHSICGGIWEARSSYIHEDGDWVYEFVCIMSSDNDVKLGDTRIMYEELTLALCHPVTITHLSKPDKRDVAIDNILSND